MISENSCSGASTECCVDEAGVTKRVKVDATGCSAVRPIDPGCKASSCSELAVDDSARELGVQELMQVASVRRVCFMFGIKRQLGLIAHIHCSR